MNRQINIIHKKLRGERAKINVLSLFDGVSCGQLALKRAGIKFDKYYASEINPVSIEITRKHFPDTMHLGDVRDVNKNKIKENIDILMGGTPCQNLSIAVINNPRHNKGLEGEKSKLFYEYIRILNEVKPKYFLLENVASMDDKDKDIITTTLGVEPIMIDSSLLSAQDRERYYWTNIPNVTQPEDKGIMIRDILESKVNQKYYYNKPFDFYGLDKKIVARLNVKSHDIGKRVYNPNNKCGTLTKVSGGYQEKKVYVPDENKVRKLTPIEYERLQTLPDNWTEGYSDSKRYSVCGDGWTVDVISHILSFINKNK